MNDCLFITFILLLCQTWSHFFLFSIISGSNVCNLKLPCTQGVLCKCKVFEWNPACLLQTSRPRWHYVMNCILVYRITGGRHFIQVSIFKSIDDHTGNLGSIWWHTVCKVNANASWCVPKDEAMLDMVVVLVTACQHCVLISNVQNKSNVCLVMKHKWSMGNVSLMIADAPHTVHQQPYCSNTNWIAPPPTHTHTHTHTDKYIQQ